MAFNFFSYMLVMLLAGVGSFGGGLGGVNIIKDFAINWNWIADEFEMLRIMSISQFNGYSQGMMLAGYLGGKQEVGLGFFGIVLGIIAFMLPSVLFVILVLKIGEKLYKNSVFKHSLTYMNLLGAGLICVILWQYLVTVFAIDMIFFTAAAGLAFYLNVFMNIKPPYIILGGVVLGIIWEIMPALRDIGA